MTKADLTYKIEGLFVTFYAETDAGVEAWNVMAAHHCPVLGSGSARALAIHADAILHQLRRAGYSVRKAPVVRQSDDELLTELFA